MVHSVVHKAKGKSDNDVYASSSKNKNQLPAAALLAETCFAVCKSSSRPDTSLTQGTCPMQASELAPPVMLTEGVRKCDLEFPKALRESHEDFWSGHGVPKVFPILPQSRTDVIMSSSLCQGARWRHSSKSLGSHKR